MDDIIKNVIVNSYYNKPEMQTTIICGFPGIGKSWICNSDSSSFSWFDKNHKIRHPQFPENYIKHIKNQIRTQKYKYIFVSSHKAVRDALIKEKIPFVCVYPEKAAKQRYLADYKNRGSSPEFIKLMEENFDKWVDEIYYDDSIPCRWQLPRVVI